MKADKQKQPHGKLKWGKIVILLDIVADATTFILFYFKQQP